MDIHFEIIKFCFFNYTRLLIIFDKNINDYIPKNKILNPNNYYLISKHNLLPLSSLINSIYCYSNNFISFNLKNDSYKLLGEYNKIKFDDSSLKNNSLIEISNNTYTISFVEKDSIESSFNNCKAVIENNHTLKIINNNIIPYYKIYKDDFYININENKFYPSEISNQKDNTLQLIFDNEITNNPLDKVSLFTTPKCNSINAFGVKLKSNDSIKVTNLLKTTIKNISLNSYIDNTLILVLEFNSKIIRYDSNDFIVYINNKLYPCTGHASFNNNLIKLTINNAYNLNFENDIITLKVLENPYMYTIDSRYLPISTNNNCKKAKYFLALKGELKSIPILNLLKLNIFFNKEIKTIPKRKSLGYLSLSENNQILTLSIDNIGKIQIYGSNLNISDTNLEYELDINSNCNVLELSINTNKFNFIDENKDIKYIDFSPSEYLSSFNSTLALISFEAPIKFYTEELTVSYPNDLGDSWSLLGMTINKPSIIFVDSSLTTRDYGNLNTLTTFLKNLYIKYKDSNINSNSININLTNIKADNAYIDVPDNFNINLDSCDFNNLEML